MHSRDLLPVVRDFFEPNGVDCDKSDSMAGCKVLEPCSILISLLCGLSGSQSKQIANIEAITRIKSDPAEIINRYVPAIKAMREPL